MQIRPIRTDKDHRAALAEIEKLWGASIGTPEGDIAARPEQLADEHGIGITAHRIAVQRAPAAVQAVDDAVDRMQHHGGSRK